MKPMNTIRGQHPGLWQAATQFENPEQGSLFDEEGNHSQQTISRVAAMLCDSRRWVTVVGATRAIVQQLVNAGVPRERIRWIHARDHAQREWATEQALLAGNSEIVLGWFKPTSQLSEKRLRWALKASNTKGLLFDDSALAVDLH